MSAPTWVKKIAPAPPPRPVGRIVRLVTPPKPLRGFQRSSKKAKAKKDAKPSRGAVAPKKKAEPWGPCANMARLLGCVVRSCRLHGPPDRRPAGKIDAAHVESRGSGGKGWGNVVGLCRSHHREQGDTGIATFQKRHGLDLAELARRIGDRVNAHDCASWQHGRRCAVCGRLVYRGVS